MNVPSQPSRLIRLGIPAVAGALLVGVAGVLVLHGLTGGEAPGDDPPPVQPPVERLARFRTDLADMAAGKRDRRELRITFSHDGKNVTGDGKGSGVVQGNGPGAFYFDHWFTLTKAQQDNLLQMLVDFPWHDVPSPLVGEVGKSESAYLSFRIRLGALSMDRTLSLDQAQPSLFDAKGKAGVTQFSHLGAKIRKLMQAAPRDKHAPLKDIGDALARIAEGTLADEMLNFSIHYRWKRKANKAVAIPEKDNAKPDPVPVNDTDGWSIANDGPIAWSIRGRDPVRVLVLSSEEMRELASLFKATGDDPALQGLEKVPDSNARRIRYRRPGFEQNTWKTNLDLHVSIMDQNLSVQIHDIEELPPEQRQRWHRVIQCLEILNRRFAEAGKPLMQL